jgi:hypothetical protein
MGVFDEVKTYCPNCGATVTFQSKGADSPGDHYDEDAYDACELPLSIAADLDRAVTQCSCGAWVRLRPCVSWVAMLPQIVKENDDA